METNYVITQTTSDKEQTIINFDNYEDALIFLQELIIRFHSEANKLDLTRNQAEVETKIGIKITYNIKEKSNQKKEMNKTYNNLTVNNLTKTDWFNQFDEYQQYQILEGLKANLDISIYAKSEFDDEQMNEIRKALKQKLPANLLVNKNYSHNQMKEIRLWLKDNLDVSEYLNTKINVSHMRGIRLKLLEDKKALIK